MKNYLLVICTFLFIGTQTSNAQLWKKLKQKAQEKIQKAEDKIVNGIDKTIDKTLEKNKETTETSTPKIKKEKDFGDASINHSHTYKKIKIGHLTQTKVNKQGNQFTISGHWWSSGVDVYDGYKVTLKNTSKEELMSGKTFQIPSEASFYIGYDPLLGDRENRKEKWKGSVKNEIESGTVKVQYVEGLSVHISFTANGTLEKFVGDSGNEHYNKKPITINGTIKTEDPRFSITKETKSSNSNSSHNDVSDDEIKKLYESKSPTVNIPDQYSFNKAISIEITDNRGEKMPLEYLLGEYPDIYGMSVNPKEMGGQGNVYVVMTPKSTTMFMDMGMMKIRKSTSLEQLGDANNFSDKLPEDGDFKYKKTGRTKSILGYNCEEYKVDYEYTNEKGSASFWVSKDFPIQNKEILMLGMKMNNPYFTGFVLEMNSTHNGENWTMKIVDVEDKNITINKNDYRKM